MNNKSLTYQKSGVNIKAADIFIKYISSMSKNRKKGSNFQNIGGFGSISDIPNNIRNNSNKKYTNIN